VPRHLQKSLDEARQPGRNLTNLEREIAAVCAPVLGVPVTGFGATTDVVPLDCDDALVAALAGDLEGEFGIQLTAEALRAARTVEGVGGLIKSAPRTEYGRPGSPELINAGEEGRTPVFCLGGLGTTTKLWKRLARLLDPAIPLRAMESAGFDEDGRPLRDLPKIAAYHVANIRALVGLASVVLVGYSFGGRVAYEMARQLHADGQAVALVLLDAPARMGKGRPPWTRQLFFYNLRRSVRRERRVLQKRVMLRARSLGIVRANDERSRVRWLIAAQTVANRDYTTRPYDGDVTLLTVDGWGRSRSESLGWASYVTGHLDIIRLEGEGLDHLGIVRARGMAAMAPILGERLLQLTAPVDQPARRR